MFGGSAVVASEIETRMNMEMMAMRADARTVISVAVVFLAAGWGGGCGLVDGPSETGRTAEAEGMQSTESEPTVEGDADEVAEPADDETDAETPGVESSRGGSSTPPPATRPGIGDDDFTLGDATGGGDWEPPEEFAPEKYDGMQPLHDSSTTVGQAMRRSCTTSTVRGLTRQLVDQINCSAAGNMTSITGIGGISLGGAVTPYLQATAVRSLKLAENERRATMYVNSALRSVAQQYLLYEWYVRGRCNIGLAAEPGTSNHESGLALDLSNYITFRRPFERHGFSWFGPGDKVHFDYVAGGTDIRRHSVRAFQKLWNANHPNDRIAVDGVWGPATKRRLLRAPASGFASGATCDPSGASAAEDLEAIEVYWHRRSDGSYKLRALAPSNVERVEYYVDGYQIGSASRSDGSNFPDAYGFHESERERHVEVRGYDGSGDEIARGVGLLDVRPGWGAYIKQMGDHLYEIGLERAPDGVAAIEVRIDGYLVKDGPTDMTRTPRNAVRTHINRLGERSFEITTYAADGSVRGHIHRTFELE